MEEDGEEKKVEVVEKKVLTGEEAELQSSLLTDLCRVDIILRNHLGRVLIPHLNDLCNDLTSMVWMESEISAQNSSTTKSSFLSANWVCWIFNCSS